MSNYLRQATASQARALGPFLDSTDFVTPETALTIANTDIKLVANGAASANKNSGGGTHRANGMYGVTFDATDTATVGELSVSVVVTGAMPVTEKFTVLEEAVYDALFAAAAAGYQVPIWASATSVVALSGTTVKTATDILSDMQAAGGVNVILSRVTTVDGSNVLISGGAIRLWRIVGEEANTTVVTLKDNAASPSTLCALAAGAIPLASGVSFGGMRCPLGLNVAIAATGKVLLVIWSPD